MPDPSILVAQSPCQLDKFWRPEASMPLSSFCRDITPGENGYSHYSQLWCSDPKVLPREERETVKLVSSAWGDWLYLEYNAENFMSKAMENLMKSDWKETSCSVKQEKSQCSQKFRREIARKNSPGSQSILVWKLCAYTRLFPYRTSQRRTRTDLKAFSKPHADLQRMEA